MSIQSFTLKNYRSFVDRTTIELRPLTLLFGYNNSGKSALLRALPLIADSLPVSTVMASEFSKSSPWRFKPPLTLDSPAVKGSSFSDLLSRISGSQEFEIELSLNDYLLQWTLRDEPQRRTHFVSRFEMWFHQDQKVEYKFLEKSSKEGLIYMDCLQQKVLEHFHFQGLIPTNLRSERVFNHLWFELAEAFATPLQWLSSVRSSPLRFNPFQGGRPDRLTPNGEGAAVILADDNITDSNVLFPRVSGWYEKHLGQKIVIVEDNREFFEIMLQPVDAPHKVNIVDTGEGLIQVLPVLVAGAMAKAGSVLAIEEPESHLQPRYHAALAEYFMELASQEEPPKILLETHSENFLLQVQLATAKGELDPKLVMIYWVRQLEDGCSIAEPVTVDDFGRLKGEWNRNVFHDAIELSQQLIQARREKGLL